MSDWDSYLLKLENKKKLRRKIAKYLLLVLILIWGVYSITSAIGRSRAPEETFPEYTSFYSTGKDAIHITVESTGDALQITSMGTDSMNLSLVGEENGN